MICPNRRKMITDMKQREEVLRKGDQEERIRSAIPANENNLPLQVQPPATTEATRRREASPVMQRKSW